MQVSRKEMTQRGSRRECKQGTRGDTSKKRSTPYIWEYIVNVLSRDLIYVYFVKGFIVLALCLCGLLIFLWPLSKWVRTHRATCVLTLVENVFQERINSFLRFVADASPNYGLVAPHIVVWICLDRFFHVIGDLCITHDTHDENYPC